MSIERGDRIILMMLRSLCCGEKHTKVADSHEAKVGIELKSVFVACSPNVMKRMLTGKLIGALEDRHLAPVHMKLLVPTEEMTDKSKLLKNEIRRHEARVWTLFVFQGRDAQQRSSDCINAFKKQYSLHQHDVYLTDNEQQVKLEAELWFKNDEVVSASNGELPVEAHEQNGGSVEEIKVEDEVDSQLNSEISTEGPHASIPSSRVNSQPSLVHAAITVHPAPEVPSVKIEKINDDPNGPTTEVISDTVDMLEPAAAPVRAPTPRPGTPAITQQPTRIE